MPKGLKEWLRHPVIAAVVGGAIATVAGSVGALAWNAISEGAIVRLLGGVTKSGYAVRFFNVDNMMRLVVNGDTKLKCTIEQHSCYLKFEEDEFEAEGTVKVDVQLENFDRSPATYGYEIWKDGVLRKADSCGLISRPDPHCDKLSRDRFVGSDAKVLYTFEIRP